MAERQLRVPARVVEYLAGGQAWANITRGLPPDCDPDRASIIRKIMDTPAYKTGDVMLRGEITDAELSALDESADWMIDACWDNRSDSEERKNLNAGHTLRARIEHLGVSF